MTGNRWSRIVFSKKIIFFFYILEIDNLHLFDEIIYKYITDRVVHKCKKMFHTQNVLENVRLGYELQNSYTPFCVDDSVGSSSACNSFSIVSADLHDGKICRWFQFPWRGSRVCAAIAF